MSIPWDVASRITFDFEEVLASQSVESKENDEWRQEKKEEDQRFKTIVCRHWLNSLCQNGEHCDFLHKYVPERMPECRKGVDCDDPLCILRHMRDEDKKKCLFFSQGFCRHGPTCKFFHEKLGPDKCPEVSDFSTPFDDANKPGEGTEVADAAQKFDRKANWRTQMCKHYETTGACPFQTTCHYAHGPAELRSRDQNIAEGIGTKEELGIADDAGSPAETFDKTPDGIDTIVVMSNLSRAGGGHGDYGDAVRKLARDLPDRRGPCKYFVVRVPDPTYQYLVVSVKNGVWACPEGMVDQMNEIFHTHDNVFLLFTVEGSGNFQGVARINGPVTGTNGKGGLGQREGLTAVFPVQWLRFCQLPYEFIGNHIAPLPTGTPVQDAPNYTELGRDTGLHMVELMYLQDEVQFDPSLIEVIPEKFKGWEGTRGYTNPATQTGFLGTVPRTVASTNGTNKLHWVNGPGFIVGCDSYIIDECFGRMVFGMPESYRGQSRFIHKGSTLLLFHMHARKLLGVFEATSNRPALIEPNAWAPNDQSVSPYPVQIRFRIVCETPMMEEAEVAQLLPDSNERVRRVEQDKMQEIVDIFVQRGGGIEEVARRNKMPLPNGVVPAGQEEENTTEEA